jgi:hypothetical protein
MALPFLALISARERCPVNGIRLVPLAESEDVGGLPLEPADRAVTQHKPVAAERHRQAHDNRPEDVGIARRVIVRDEMATRVVDIERVELGFRDLVVAGTERSPDLGENPDPVQVQAAHTQYAVSREQLAAVPHARS